MRGKLSATLTACWRARASSRTTWFASVTSVQTLLARNVTSRAVNTASTTSIVSHLSNAGDQRREPGLHAGGRRRQHAGRIGADLEAERFGLLARWRRARRAGRQHREGRPTFRRRNGAADLVVVDRRVEEQNVGALLDIH